MESVELAQVIEGAISAIKDSLIEEDKKIIAKTPENELIVQLHHTLGRWIRNNFGLWSGNTVLYSELKKIDLHHADDMSGLLLRCAIRDIKKKDRNVKEYIDSCKNYWKSLPSQ